MITAQRVRELFDYDPDTGVFTRRVSTGSRSMAGMKVGHIVGEGYLAVMIDRKNYLLHRLVWLWVHGRWPTAQVDHINGERADNRLANLRETDVSGNGQNRRPRRDSASGLLGVSYVSASGRWRASIQVDGASRYLGEYATPEIAHAVYLDAKVKLHPMQTAVPA